ncbi:MAG: hypothetical protein EZS28_051287, partial [Streblomastix strix]
FGLIVEKGKQKEFIVPAFSGLRLTQVCLCDSKSGTSGLIQEVILHEF